MVKLLRSLLGGVLSGLSRLTQPRAVTRAPEEQARVDAAVKALAIYQFAGCPFCIKVRRTVHRLALPIEYRDASQGSDYRQELADEGGKVQVPCLRIESADGVEWLYESDAVISYLDGRFG